MDALTDWRIRQALDVDPDVEHVLAQHHALMRSQSPEESCHVMTAVDLRASGALVFALESQDWGLCAVGALKPFGQSAVELKSMHTVQAHRGKGVGRALLDHLLHEARTMGAQSAWLETGSDTTFAPARALYHKAGFTDCPPFGDYVVDPLSVFMQRDL